MEKIQKLEVDDFGKILSPILLEIEGALIDYADTIGKKPNYEKYALRSAINIFTSTLMDRIWDLQDKEEMDLDTRKKMAQKCGEDIRKLVKVYADIDTYDLT